MAKPLHFDKIEEYLTGQMTEEEIHRFEQEAANDEQLASELKLQRLEHDAMEQMLEQELKTKMSAAWADSPPVNPFLEKTEAKVVQMDTKKNWQWMRIAAAVGGVLLIAVLLWRTRIDQPNEIVNEPVPIDTPADPEPIEPETPTPLPPEDSRIVETPKRPKTEEIAPPPEIRPEPTPAPPPEENTYIASAKGFYEPPVDMASGLRSSGETPTEKSTLLQAAEALDGEKDQKVLDLLGLPEAGDQSVERYIRGHAFFRTGEYEAAASEFKVMADVEMIPYHLESQWYLLLSYFAQLPATEKAFKDLATQLSEDEYSDYRTKAKELLDMVK